MRSPRRPAGPIMSASVVVLLVVGVLSGCSSSSSSMSTQDCVTKYKAAFSSIIAANEGLLPFIQQFADGKLPPAAEFNAANQKLATAVTEANDLLGVTK